MGSTDAVVTWVVNHCHLPQSPLPCKALILGHSGKEMVLGPSSALCSWLRMLTPQQGYAVVSRVTV